MPRPGDVFEHTVLMLNLMNKGQTGKSAPHVEQAFQPAHPEDELAANPFRPVEPAESLHTTQRRLADSIATAKLKQWKEELEI